MSKFLYDDNNNNADDIFLGKAKLKTLTSIKSTR